MQSEIEAMKTMKDVIDWAGFTGDDLSSEKTVGGTLAMLLGVTESTAPRSLALVDEADALAVIQKWKVPKIDADGNCTYHSPTIAQLGQAKLVFRACKVVCGNGQTLEDLQKQLKEAQAQTQSSATPTAVSTAADRKVKLSAILSQVDDSEAKVMSEKDLVTAYMRYSGHCIHEVLSGVRGIRTPTEGVRAYTGATVSSAPHRITEQSTVL